MRQTIAMVHSVAVLLVLPLSGHAGNLNPPEVTSTTGEPIYVRRAPGFQAQCNRTTVTHQRFNPNPTTQTTSFGSWVEARNGREFLGAVFDFEGDPVNLVFELTTKGEIKGSPPTIETRIPGFERRYGAELRQLGTNMISGMAGNFLGRQFEVGRDYGPTMDVCVMTGHRATGWPEGTTVARGTLTFEGRPAYLITQTFRQSCTTPDATVSFEGSAWGVYEKTSGQPIRSASEFSAFTQNGRIMRAEEFTNCTITQR